MTKYTPIFTKKQLLIAPLKPLIKISEDSLHRDVLGEVVMVGSKTEDYIVGDIVLFDEKMVTKWTYDKSRELYKMNDEAFVLCKMVEK